MLEWNAVENFKWGRESIEKNNNANNKIVERVMEMQLKSELFATK